MADQPSLNRCRHFLGLMPNSCACAKGRDVRTNARNANGGSSLGIALRLPCTAGTISGEPPLFDCPDLDRKTDEEIQLEQKKSEEDAEAFFNGFGRILEIKKKMIDQNLMITKTNCPWCGGKDTLSLSCAINSNKHMSGSCRACDKQFME